MGQTITEKILAAHCDKQEVHPGEFIEARVDFCHGNDVTAPIAIREFESLGKSAVFDKERIGIIPDHFAPPPDIQSAEQINMMRQFSRKYEIKHFFELGEVGIEHALLPEKGLSLPGDVLIGADSHTCTYGALGAFATGVGSTDLAYAFATGKTWFKVPESMKIIFKGKKLPKWVGGKDLILELIGKISVSGALYKTMEFTGELVPHLSMDARMTIANMVIEAGGKNGIFAPDAITTKYIKKRAQRTWHNYASDPDAHYCDEVEIDGSTMEPVVACPNLPDNVKRVTELTNVVVDQVVIGSCTNGRMEDLREAAHILKGRKVNPNLRVLIFPGTQDIAREAQKHGLVDIFLDAGCVFSTTTCGPCLGAHMGVLAEGETAIATTNRNFTGRMGHPKSSVYLSNPAVAAASAVLGRIAHPDEVH